MASTIANQFNNYKLSLMNNEVTVDLNNTNFYFQDINNSIYYDLTNNTLPKDNQIGLYEVPWYIITILSILYGTISILSVVGNGLIVWVVLKNKRMHNVTNYFISNLAAADIVIGMFATPFQFQAALLQYWVLPKIMCKVAPFATTLSVNVSIFTLVAISLDRYYVILYPLKPKLRVKQCFTILVSVWIIALLLSSLHLYNYFVNTPVNHLPRCEVLNLTIFKYHVLILVLIQYVIPFIIISFTYFRIGYHIYFDSSVNAVNQKQEQNKRKVLKMIFIVVNLFMLCWAPLQLYNILNFINPSINEYKYINILWFAANFFAMSNSCYNVFIYGVCSARYKREFRRVLSCLPCVNKSLLEYDIVNQSSNRRQTMCNKSQKLNQSHPHIHSTNNATIDDKQTMASKLKMKIENDSVTEDFNSSYRIKRKINKTKNDNNKKQFYANFKFLNKNNKQNGNGIKSNNEMSYNTSTKSRSFEELVNNDKIKISKSKSSSNNANDIDRQIKKFY